MQGMTFTTHSLAEYSAISLEEHGQAIFQYLRQNPTASVLDIGCGEGLALKDLKRHFPSAQLYGLDINKPTKQSDKFTFIQGRIENLPDHYFKRFDLIISVNVLVYVEKKIQALTKISKALTNNPGAKAYIGINPFYFGPFGERMFKNIEGFKWDKGYRNLIVKPGKNKNLQHIIQKFSSYEIPQCLMVNCWDSSDRPNIPTVDIPVFYSEKVTAKLKKQNNVVRIIKQSRCWLFWNFIKVQTINPTGPEGASEGNFRPVRFADSHVYLPHKLTEQVIVMLLINPYIYDNCIKQENWIPSENYSMVIDQFKKSQYFRTLTSEELIQFMRAKYLVNTASQALCSAIQENNKDDFHRLCENVKNINETDTRQNTPLHIALSRKNDEFTSKLLSQGAKLNIKNTKKETANDLLIKIFNQPDCVNDFPKTSKALEQQNDLDKNLQKAVNKHKPAYFGNFGLFNRPNNRPASITFLKNLITISLFIALLATFIQQTSSEETPGNTFQLRD